jgi:triacylglycerol lipase
MTYPIVLAHGIARFDVLLRDLLKDEERADDSTHYFRLIRSTLQAAGFNTYHSSVPWAESVAVRSRALRANVEQVLAASGARKAHIIAHSMGGLDARHMLFDGRADGLHGRIASVTTIGTPHRGTSFADWGVTSESVLLAILATLGITTIDGFRDLTTKSCAAFNAQAESFELRCGVAFRAYAGAQDLPYVFEPLKLAWHIIKHHEGDNDGLVAVSSARWRDEFAAPTVINADHLNEVGWWEPNDLGFGLDFARFPPRPRLPELPGKLGERIRGLYLQIARDLAAQFP